MYTSKIVDYSLKFTKYVGQKNIFLIEDVLAWTVVIVFAIRYALDYTLLRLKIHRLADVTYNIQPSPKSNVTESSLCGCIPLCPLAHTRAELCITIEERWQRLHRALLSASTKIKINAAEENKERVPPSTSISSISTTSIERLIKKWKDKDWIEIFHSSLEVRREASWVMFSLTLSKQIKNPSQQILTSHSLSTMRQLWSKFMELPQSVKDKAIRDGNCDKLSSYDLSVIVPVYKERIALITSTLNRALTGCKGDPERIEIIIVHAQSYHVEKKRGDTDEVQQLLDLKQEQQNCWGKFNIVTVPFEETLSGGRGKTLNTGAKIATAPVLTFLHADTKVPNGWDEQIKHALLFQSQQSNGDKYSSTPPIIFPHACAFTMGIDRALSKNSPGLFGAELLGVLRCYCGLPYGDSVLSFRRTMFDYMGGYPEQKFMEDYEVMDWLRLRSYIFSSSLSTSKNNYEGLVLLRDQIRCSPRRWQKYGVAYTSLVNAVCIHRYRKVEGTTAEDLFEFYYHCNDSSDKVKVP